MSKLENLKNKVEELNNQLKKQMELANEAVNLIEEFNREALIFRVSSLRGLAIKNYGMTIEVDDEYDDVIEYSLSSISSVFQSEMRGWGPNGPSIYEGIGYVEQNFRKKFDSKDCSKEEFIEHVGSLKYAEFRCEDIYKRLEEIEEEVEKLDIYRRVEEIGKEADELNIDYNLL